MKRTRGTGSIYVKHGAYYARWRTPEGRKLNRKLGPVRSHANPKGLTKAQAERRLRELIDEPQTASTSATVAELGEALAVQLELKERKPSTVEAVRSAIRVHLHPFFGNTPVERIDDRDVERLALALRNKGLAPKSVRNYLSTLHSIFEYARKRRIVRENPASLADLPVATYHQPKEIQFFTEDQLEKLLRATAPPPRPGEEDWWPTEAVLYLTAALTGLRKAELRALRWRDVDWTAAKLRVHRTYVREAYGTTKSTRSFRAVPMHDRVAEALEHRHTLTPWQGHDDLVFPNPQTGNPLDATKIRKRFQAACARAGVPVLRFHDLRHTFGTRMAAAGTPMRSIQEWMGHRDYKTTLIYAHYAPSPHERAWLEAAFRCEGGHDAGPTHEQGVEGESGRDDDALAA